MAVRWIGDAAAELGLDILDAVELLATKQNYPMNGLVDEDRVNLLKMYRGRGVDGTGRHAVPPAPPAPRVEPPPVPEDAVAVRSDIEVTSVTSPLPTQRDKTEDRTVIMPTPAIEV